MGQEIRAPVELASIIELLNTLDERTYSHHGVHRRPGDELATRELVARWLKRLGHLPRSTSVTTMDAEQVRSFRDHLRGLLAAGPRSEAASPPWHGLNGLLAGLQLLVRFDAGGTPQLAANSQGARGILAQMAATAAISQSQGTWQRVHMCAASDCRWIFYDTSRNGAGRWCSMAVCGNRTKTRRYRERHAPR